MGFRIGRLTRLDLGVVGETESRIIEIDVSEWLERWPGAAVAVNVRRPDGYAYLAATEVEDGLLSWVLTAGDTAVAGKGLAEVRAYDFTDGKVYKSRTVQTTVAPTLAGFDEPEAPDPMGAWSAIATEAKAGAETARDTAVDAAASAAESEGAAIDAKQMAEAAANSASNDAYAASGARIAAQQFSTDAQEAAKAAETAAEAAEKSAKAAVNASESANSNCAAAKTFASNAALSESAAKESADLAAEKAIAASESAQAASTSAASAANASQFCTAVGNAANDYARIAAEKCDEANKAAATSAGHAAAAAASEASAGEHAAAAVLSAENADSYQKLAKLNADKAVEAAEIAQDYATAPPIVVEADGALVVIGDGGARPVVRLVSSMAAVQSGSGEPSPENIRAIAGWDSVTVHRTGQNLVSLTDYEVTSGHNASVITADVIDVVTPSAFDYGRIPVLLKGGVTYTLVIDWEVYGREADSTKATRSAYRMRDVEDSYYQNSVYGNAARRFVRVYKPETDVETVVLWHPNYGGDLPSSSRSRVMLLVGEYTADTAPAFVPGDCAALTAALPETVYGGHLDWASGLLTVTHGLLVLDGTEAWASNGGTQYYTLDELPRAGVSAVYPVCTHYTGGNAYTGSIANGVLVSPTKIWLRDARFDSDTAGLKAWFAAQAAAGTPVQIVYQLAEPYTVRIDPQVLETLRGSNVIWSDCGNTAVAYVADTKIYIDNAVAAIAASIINA